MKFFPIQHKEADPKGRPWIEFPNSTDSSPLQSLNRICLFLWQPAAQSKIAEIEGQGVGSRPDSYEIKQITVFNKVLHLNDTLRDDTIRELRMRGIETLQNNKGIDLTESAADEASIIMNDLFLIHFKLKPYNEKGHYNIAAYWK